MDRNILKSVVLGNQYEIEKIELVERNIIIDEYERLVLVGIRRAGKSFLLYQKIKDNLKKGIGWDEMLYINFEDERLSDFNNLDFDLLLELHFEIYAKRPMLFLDEIQNIAGWEKFARRVADQKYKVFITGSNAYMLSNEIQTTLGGRFIVKEVFPFSFGEYLKFNEMSYSENDLFVTEKRAAIKNKFSEYFSSGGFPESLSVSYKRDYINGIYQKIFLGDIAARYSINNYHALNTVIRKLAESVKQPMSFNRIANIVSSTGVKFSVNSAIKYMEYIENAWLVLSVDNIAGKIVDKMTNKKYYFADNGILNLFLTDSKTTLLENIVAVNLLRKYGRRDNVYFYHNNIEIDFYVDDLQQAYQVSFSIADKDTRHREVTALKKIHKVLPVKKCFIITYDEEETIIEDNIVINVVPIWKWLLNYDAN